MVALINLPSYQPGNALSFQGINQAIDSNRQNALAQAQIGMQRERLGMEREQHGLQMKQARTQQELQEARMAAGRIQYIKGLPAEQQAAAWQQTLTQPGFRDLPENMRDFNTAAPMIEARAAEYLGEKDKAQIGLIKANTAKALREASEAGGYGKDVKLFQDEFGRTWGVQAGSRGDLKFHNLSSPGSQPTTQPPPGFPNGAGNSSAVPQGTPGGPQQAARPSLTPFARRTVVGDRVFNPATGKWEGSAAEALEGGKIAEGRGEHIVKLEASLPKSRASMESANAKVDIVMDQIAAARPIINGWSTGFGAVAFDRLPATLARNLKGRIDTIVANLGFDELQEMRANSPTGGALGQVAVQELDMLQKTKVALDRARSAAEVTQALDELENFYKGKPVVGRDGKPVLGPDGQPQRQGGAVERRQRAFEETYAPLRQRRTGNSHEVTGPRVPRQFNDRMPPPQSGVQGDMPRPSSPEEAARLPRGTRFLAPDGSVRMVP